MPIGKISQLEQRISQLEEALNQNLKRVSNPEPEIENIQVLKDESKDPHTISETIFYQMLVSSPWPTTPPNDASFGWDSLVDPWIDLIPSIGDKIPSAYRIWLTSRRYLDKGDTERATRAQRLNYLLHQSYIPASCEIRGEVTFAYGGIGVILHPQATINEYCTIGAHVTIGGNGHPVRKDGVTGKSSTVPLIGSLVTLGACANITGGIEIGSMTIVAPNATLSRSTHPGEIIGGVPGKTIGQVTLENALRYKAKYLPARSWSDEKFMEYAQKVLVA